MKRHIRKIVLTLLAVAALVLIALVLKDSGDGLRTKPYDALAPTGGKFARLARWIPPGSEFDVTVDVPRALANPMLRARLMDVVRTKRGVASELVAALLSKDGSVGLLTVAGTLGEPGVPPKVVVIAQGRFEEDAILSVVRQAMTEGRAGLSAQTVGSNTIYYESDARHPFGFMILDGAHMAVGEKDALASFFLPTPPPPEALTAVQDQVVFGHLQIGPRLKNLVPGMVSVPESVVFSSADGAMLQATLVCDSAAKAAGLKLFLEGVKALMLLQHEHTPALADILAGISIDSGAAEVIVTTKIAPLLALWAGSSDEERDDAARPHAHEPPVGELELGHDGKPQE